MLATPETRDYLQKLMAVMAGRSCPRQAPKAQDDGSAQDESGFPVWLKVRSRAHLIQAEAIDEIRQRD
jgi:hypothetical protein